MHTRNKLELLVNNDTVIGVVATSDLAAVKTVAENALNWSIGEFDFDVATKAGSSLSRHDGGSWWQLVITWVAGSRAQQRGAAGYMVWQMVVGSGI